MSEVPEGRNPVMLPRHGSPDWSRSPDGLLPAIVQDIDNGRLLMVAWMDREAYQATLETRYVHFRSRSRDELWRKGATSGNELEAIAIIPDCDADALLVLSKPSGPTCHTGAATCFETRDARIRSWFVPHLEHVLEERRGKGSYSDQLLQDLDLARAKIEEEAEEVTRASRDEGKDRLLEEAADLLYHLTALLHGHHLSLRDVVATLRARHRAPQGK